MICDNRSFLSAVVIVISATLVLWVPNISQADRKQGDDLFLRIAYGRQVKEKDGSVTQRFYIKSSNGTRQISNHSLGYGVEAFYTTGGPREKGKEKYIQADVKYIDDACYLDINAGSFEQINLYVTGRFGRKHFMAQTTCFLFGNAINVISKGKDKTKLSNNFDTHMPRLFLKPERHHYWMQTGETYTFIYKGMHEAQNTVEVIDNLRSVQTIETDQDSAFSYTPPHDRELNWAAHDAVKEIFFLIKESSVNGEYTTAYTLLLHRSRFGNHRLLAGVLLFSVTGLTAIFISILRRRRFHY